MNKKYMQVIPSIILYIIAGLLAIYAVWSYIFCADIISQARAAGQLAAGGNAYDIASFYMSNCGQYVVFALLLAAAGFLLQRKSPAQSNLEDELPPAEDESADDEPDDWFDEDA